MRTLPILALGLLSALAPSPRGTEASSVSFHFQLEDSSPAPDAKVQPPSEVRLRFTQVPRENTTSIRLLDPAGEPIHTGQVMQDPENERAFSVEIHGNLSPGRYTVAWRALGNDGHVVRGDYRFTVLDS